MTIGPDKVKDLLKIGTKKDKGWWPRPNTAIPYAPKANVWVSLRGSEM